MNIYQPKSIEGKWQKQWEESGVNESIDFSEKPKYYVLVEFPYPSGDGLHVGHCRSYVAQDVIARKKRMDGFNVMYPIGWDAFGLPAENYAIKHKVHPRVAVERNIENFKSQIKSLGISFDWKREVNTTDPEYYKWTQWIFRELYKKGLAYKKAMAINWCPSCKIGLANEEVVNGGCERCGETVSKKYLNQWMLKITDYADKLIEGLDEVDYLPQIKQQQLNWIGRSEGARINFETGKNSVEVFTTRPDTIYGVTYLVLAPEHELVEKITTAEQKEVVLEYQKQAALKSDRDRQIGNEKTGVFTGAYAKHPITEKEIPIWVADYALASVGTGAVMAVPAHDERDWEFAKKYDLEIITVVKGEGFEEGKFFGGHGNAVNSDFLNDLSTEEAKEKAIDWLKQNNKGDKSTNYKLRDWVFSRQHYWGEPIPIVHCDQCGEVLIPESELPLVLPDVESYEPTDTGESPLAAITDWVDVKCPECGEDAQRETDTMPNWAGSSWYFLRYVDPKNNDEFASKEKLDYWGAVDLYNGGMEHVTLHLLYSRFWHRFLYDIGKVPHKEPYGKRIAHGMILADGGVKMSKSKGNVVNPTEIIDNYGADVLRLYEMFMGPYDQSIAWSEETLAGMNRFLSKIWKLHESGRIEEKEAEKKILAALHKMIQKVDADIEKRSYNTAVSEMMIFINTVVDHGTIAKSSMLTFLKVANVFVPHLCQELWSLLGKTDYVCEQQWPEVNEAFILEEDIEFVIQINGKVRDKIQLPQGLSEEELKDKALASESLQKHLAGKEIKKTIVVPNRLINFVV